MKRTAKFYASHPESRAKHVAYQATYNKKPREVKKRVELNRANRKTNGYHDGKDLAHVGNKLVKKSPSKNRGSKSDQAGDRRARG